MKLAFKIYHRSNWHYWFICTVVGAFSIPVFVLATEFSGIRHRSTAGSLIWLGFVAAIMTLAGMAYFIRDWRKLTVSSGAPGILLVPFWLWVTRTCFCWVSGQTSFWNVYSSAIVVNVLILRIDLKEEYEQKIWKFEISCVLLLYKDSECLCQARGVARIFQRGGGGVTLCES